MNTTFTRSRIVLATITIAAFTAASHGAQAKCYSATATTTNASKAGAVSYARAQSRKTAWKRCHSTRHKFACTFPRKTGLNLHARCTSMATNPNNGRDGVVWTCRVTSTACAKS